MMAKCYIHICTWPAGTGPGGAVGSAFNRNSGGRGFDSPTGQAIFFRRDVSPPSGQLSVTGEGMSTAYLLRRSN